MPHILSYIKKTIKTNKHENTDKWSLISEITYFAFNGEVLVAIYCQTSVITC